MSLTIGKPVNIPGRGLEGMSLPDTVSEVIRITPNKDDTITILVEFFKDQATLDAPDGKSFLTKSYDIPSIPALENMINVGLKTLPDFDLAI